MRTFRRVFTLTFVLLTLLLPVVAYAADPPPYFVSDAPIGTSTANPNGSGTDPFIADDPIAVNEVCVQVAKNLTGAESTLYYVRVSRKEYYQYRVIKGTDNQPGKCVPQGKIQRGAYPPGFGVTFTPALVIGGLTLVGLVLLSAAWLLYRRFRSNARTA